jgi:two-component system alkaline phosphatase synthesis response regulator PhoP
MEPTESRARILVVDDNGDMLDILARVLSSEGYEVETAEGGDRAIEKASRGHFDLFILDIAMPGIDGYHACFEIKHMEKYAETPVIMLTALGEGYQKSKGEILGADVYLTKPFSRDDLLAHVRRRLRKQP